MALSAGLAPVAFIAVLGGCGPAPETDDADEQVVVGVAPPASGGMASVVLLEPETVTAPRTPADTALMDQYTSTFLPGLLVVRVGQPVEFRNSEDVSHMVRVVDTDVDSTLFNVATPMGSPHVHAFERAGGYAVSCDIHPAMTAFILVVTAPYHAVAAADGSYEIADVPPGSYTLRTWSRDSTLRSERVVEIGQGRTVVGGR